MWPQPNNMSMAPAARTPGPPRFARRITEIRSQTKRVNPTRNMATRTAVDGSPIRVAPGWLVQQRREASAPSGEARILGRQQCKGLEQVFTPGARGERAVALHAGEQRLHRRVQ